MGRIGAYEIIAIVGIILVIIYFVNRRKGSQSDINEINRQSKYHSSYEEKNTNVGSNSTLRNESPIPLLKDKDGAGIR